MIKPNFTGKRSIFDTPTNTEFTAANIVAIDAPATSLDIYPYARTATVEEYHASANFFALTGTTSLIPSGNKLAFGVFLTADNDLKNLLFTCTGKVNLTSNGNVTKIKPFFGRTVASTVTSSLAAASNQVSEYILLPSTDMSAAGVLTQSCSIETDVYSIENTSGYNYVFGVELENDNGADTAIVLDASLQLQKYSTSAPVYSPINH